MMKLLFSASMLAILSFTACDSNEPKTTSEEDAMLLNTATSAAPGSAAALGGSITPVATPSGSTPQSVTAPATQAAKTAAGVNPPHGQPSHRCDIAEGAPLDGAPANAQQPNAGVTVTPAAKEVQKTNQSQPGTTPASGTNPAHGEQGHRCDIAVGAPLNGTK
ncbi:MAG TPA: hypothetical protein PL009_09230 [Flavipsychrobacter sp.]|nr:hypothetical protein [Flavipsychrobacter sp.]